MSEWFVEAVPLPSVRAPRRSAFVARINFLRRRAGIEAGVHGARVPIESKRQTKGRAPAAQEGRERRDDDAAAALFELGPQALAAAGEHQRVAEADGIGCKPGCILDPDLDHLLWRKPFPDLGSASRGERCRNVKHLAAGQWAERRIDVIEASVHQFERDDLDAEYLLDSRAGGGIRTRAISHPEQVPRLVPDAVACSFEHEAIGQLSHGVDAPPSV